MIREEIKNIKSGKRKLRQFGIVIGIILGLWGIWFWWLGERGYACLLIISLVFIFFGLVLPILLKPIHKSWMTFAILMGWLVTRVIVTILFYLIVTPIGLLARLCGKDFLNTKFDKKINSYWVQRKVVKGDKRKYENQF